MAEPSSTVVAAAAGAVAIGTGFWAGFDGYVAVGSLCGALVHFISSKEVAMVPRLLYFVISWVMGYLAAPAIAQAEVFGIGPIELPALAAFICSALIVTVTLAAIRTRGQASPREG